MPDPTIVFMFSGQGSHYLQMGRAMYDTQPTFRRWMDRMDGIVREASGHSVIARLYDQQRSRGDVFDRTLVSHPAIFMLEYAMSQTLIDIDVVPDMVLSTSVGTFGAAVLAGCIDFESALIATVENAKALEASCEEGAMLAILAPPSLFEQTALRQSCELAAINFDSHFVVATTVARLADVEGLLRERNTAFQRLPVSFAFHSKWIDAAKPRFQAYAQSLVFKPAILPLVCCAEAQTLSVLPNEYLWTVIRKPIRFRETIQSLEREGPHIYVDVGPAGTLATFTKYVLPRADHSRIHTILSPFGKDAENLAAVAARLASKRSNLAVHCEAG